MTSSQADHNKPAPSQRPGRYIQIQISSLEEESTHRDPAAPPKKLPLQQVFDNDSLSLKASKPLTWAMLIVYGVWGSVPFSFIVFYAGLQTVPGDTLEAAMIDGANRWQRVWYVIIPYMMPLVVFITLIMLMDNFRVLEPIIGFSAQANATSLSWIIFNDLRAQDPPFFGSASATSMLTIIGVGILLIPMLIRTWRDFNSKTV